MMGKLAVEQFIDGVYMRKGGLIVLVALACLVSGVVEAKIYRWEDNKGITHFTNDEQKIPEAYRKKVKISNLEGHSQSPKNNKTVIHFKRKGNAVLLNAVLNYKLPVVFHLDTGATETLITPEDAKELGIDTRNAPTVSTRVADGRKVEFPKVLLQSVRVGNAEVKNLSVLVGQSRLLGLSFLNEFKMTMDSEHGQLILENPTHQRELESQEVVQEKERLIAEYEAKQEKLRLSVEAVKKNIAIVNSEIETLQSRKESLESQIQAAGQKNLTITNPEELEAELQRLQLAIETRQLKIEGYNKDIEILENNIDYYQNWIQKFQ